MSDNVVSATEQPSNPEWAMRFDGRYWTFTRDGRFHVHEDDGSLKAIVEVTWGAE